MKIVILAGGFGTRISEYTDLIPKPMIEIGGKPILNHIMNIYSHFGYNDFVIALGYKGEVIKKYFYNYSTINSDFTLEIPEGKITKLNKIKNKFKVTLIDTGEKTMTGGRIKRLQSVIGNNTFMMTYGDAVSDVNIKELVKFHKTNKLAATVTAVHPPARFGALEINDKNMVNSFKEKPQTSEGWINGGFFVFEPEIFNYINGDSVELEKKPLEQLASQKKLAAFKHFGYWQSMDTLRDKKILEDIWNGGNAPWIFPGLKK